MNELSLPSRTHDLRAKFSNIFKQKFLSLDRGFFCSYTLFYLFWQLLHSVHLLVYRNCGKNMHTLFFIVYFLELAHQLLLMKAAVALSSYIGALL